MKKGLWLLGLLMIFSPLWAGDDFIKRPDLYGTPPAQWKYVNLTSTTSVKITPGVLHCITVNKTAAQVMTVIDSTSTNVLTPLIATFPASPTVGDYCYDIYTSNGIQINLPAAGPDVTVSYR